MAVSLIQGNRAVGTQTVTDCDTWCDMSLVAESKPNRTFSWTCTSMPTTQDYTDRRTHVTQTVLNHAQGTSSSSIAALLFENWCSKRTSAKHIGSRILCPHLRSQDLCPSTTRPEWDDSEDKMQNGPTLQRTVEDTLVPSLLLHKLASEEESPTWLLRSILTGFAKTNLSFPTPTQICCQQICTSRFVGNKSTLSSIVYSTNLGISQFFFRTIQICICQA